VIAAFVGLGVLLFVLAWGVWVYNRLVALRNRCRNAWAQMDVQLRRRMDLIPNLVEAVRGYLKHERETLERVIAARNEAMQAWKAAEVHPEDASAMARAGAAQAVLGQALMGLRAVMENYPDLKAERPIRELMEELTSTENRVAFARQAYNDEVMRYNTKIESFPELIVARAFGFVPFALWREEDSAARKPVRFSLTE